MARGGSVPDGIAAEIVLTAPLRSEADWVLDTSELPPPELRLDFLGRLFIVGEKLGRQRRQEGFRFEIDERRCDHEIFRSYFDVERLHGRDIVEELSRDRRERHGRDIEFPFAH